MRLSEAMMLGSATCKMKAGDWNSCGLGCAANAIGIKQAVPENWNYLMPDGRQRFEHIYAAWPWLEGNETAYAGIIWSKFDLEVCQGEMTFEQLVDYVREIEPECGECNRFECVCVKDEAASEVEVEALK